VWIDQGAYALGSFEAVSEWAWPSHWDVGQPLTASMTKEETKHASGQTRRLFRSRHQHGSLVNFLTRSRQGDEPRVKRRDIVGEHRKFGPVRSAHG
jgi:hypothetical protein